VDENENTPLHTAASLGNVELSEMLLRLGASTRIVNWMGQTAREVALEAGREEVATRLSLSENSIFSRNLPSETLRSRKAEGRMGDWDCAQCGATVWANKRTCFRCGAAKPHKEMEEIPLEAISGLGKFMLSEMASIQKVQHDDG
jgi:rubrerythrin